MNSEPTRIFAFLPRFDKPSSGRDQHMTCLDFLSQRFFCLWQLAARCHEEKAPA
jgi:hypothetical protein